uniref:Uncharacterized protein n=1 Tax=Glossina austeni TaxID=7395 RepID=A0A1A9VR59_GLOAU
MADDPVNQQQFMQDVAAAEGPDGYINLGDPNNLNMPSLDEVLQLIEQMKDLSEEERENLRENLLKYTQTGTTNVVSHSTWDYTIFLAMIVLIMVVFVFFGYKLYVALKQRELRKEGKLKRKEMKKTAKTN